MSEVTDAQIEVAFTGAWIKCMTEHDATLVSGPCSRCTAEASERLWSSDETDSKATP